MSLKVLIYNVHLFGGSLPYFIQWVAHLYYKDQERMLGIMTSLLFESADIVGLVELWDDDLAKELCLALHEQYPYTWRVPPTDPASWKIGTGLLFLSRYPLTNQSFIQYTDHVLLEHCAEKGVAAVTVDFQVPVRVLLTHTHAGMLPSERHARFKDFFIIAEMIQCDPDIFTIIMGDFNTYADEDSFYEPLKATDVLQACSDTTEPINTFDSEANETVYRFYPFLRWFAHKNRFDRILFLQHVQDPGYFKPCALVVEQEQYRFLETQEPCSDHWPVRAEFQFIKTISL